VTETKAITATKSDTTRHHQHDYHSHVTCGCQPLR